MASGLLDARGSRFRASPRQVPRPAPLLGEHTDEILAKELGLSAAEIGALHDSGVVAGPKGVQ
jgi:2-methylfumaryl-CoA isomerase